MGDLLTGLKKLLPPGDFFEKEDWDSLLSVLANEYARIQADAESLLNEFIPVMADHILLDDWIRILGLTQMSLSVEEQKQAVFRSFTHESEQTEDAYIKLIESFGFKNPEIELCKMASMDQLTCTDLLFDDSWLNHTFIKLSQPPIFYLNCQSYCTDPFWQISATKLKEALNQYILAHTRVWILEKPHEAH